jgi:hypothetical protein
VQRQLAVVTVDSDTVGVLCKMPHIFAKAEYADKLWGHGYCDGGAAAGVDGSIFENVLYKVNCTNLFT